MLSVDAALRLVLERVRPLPARPLPLTEAIGLRTTQSIASDIDSPPHDKSVVDGYAVRFDDLQGGIAELRVIEEVTAGQVPRYVVEPGTATRIMTGAPVPAGADAVVMVERSSQPEPGTVRLEEPRAVRGQNIVARGKVMRRGEVVLPAGARLTPAVIGLATEAGCTVVDVAPRPRAAIVATGNELVPAEQVPQPGQIRNSNGPMLAALATRAGAEVLSLGIARDEREALRHKIVAGLAADLLMLSGGVSAGVLDLVPGVLQELGVREVFHKVSLKPGKPLWFGVWESPEGVVKPVFGLPGNPVSTLVCFELFVQPAIAALRGDTELADTRFAARLTQTFQHRGDRPTYWPARREAARKGGVENSVTPLRWQGSGDLRALADADSLICFPAGDRQFAEGEEVLVRPLS